MKQVLFGIIFTLISCEGNNHLKFVDKEEHYIPSFLDKEMDRKQWIYFDYYEGLISSKKNQKPILLSFFSIVETKGTMATEALLNAKTVDTLIREKFITVILYSDDRTKLSITNPDYLLINGIRPKYEIKTRGHLNSFIQKIKTKRGSLPAFVILDSNGIPIGESIGLIENHEEFKSWLEVGIAKFDNAYQ